MKRHVQGSGIRKWFGDDYINLQNELYLAIDNMFSGLGNFVYQGCTVSGAGPTYDVAAGYVLLKDSSGNNPKICRFDGTTGATLPIYLVQDYKDKDDVAAYGRAYKDAVTRDIINEYYAKIETSLPAHANYVKIEITGPASTWSTASGKYDAANVSTTPTANKVLPLDANGKLPTERLDVGGKETFSHTTGSTVNLAEDTTNLDYALVSLVGSNTSNVNIHLNCRELYMRVSATLGGGSSATVNIKYNGTTLLTVSSSATYYYHIRRIGNNEWLKLSGPDVSTIVIP